MNLDESTTLGQPEDPLLIPNVNTPMVDLETIYNFDVSFFSPKFLHYWRSKTVIVY